jgi:hypothetical protein
MARRASTATGGTATLAIGDVRLVVGRVEVLAVPASRFYQFCQPFIRPKKREMGKREEMREGWRTLER